MSDSETKTAFAARAKPGEPGKLQVLLGRLINRAGHLTLPLGVGAIIGFYAADQGVRWLPTLLGIVLLVFVLGFLAIPLGRALQGRAFDDSPERRRLRKRVVVFLALASAAVVLRLALFAERWRAR